MAELEKMNITGSGLYEIIDAGARTLSQMTVESVYPTKYNGEDSAGALTLNHSGINANNGATLSGEWGRRSAITGALLIPPSGLRIEMEPGSEPWMFGVWCYKAASILSGNFVYSPTNKQMVDAGTSVIVFPTDGAKYARVQFRCKTNASTTYGGYRPLTFEGEDGVEPGTGDDTTIRSLFSTYAKPLEMPKETTHNLISPTIFDDAKMYGIDVNGGMFTCPASALRTSIPWNWVKYNQNLPAGKYTVSLEYSTGEMTAGNLGILFVDSAGNEINTILLNRSSSLRRFSKVLDISQDRFSVRCFTNSLAAPTSAVITICNAQLVAGEHAEPYALPLTAIDSTARNIARAVVSDHVTATDNLFNLEKAYRDSQNVELDDGILTGTNTAFKSITLLQDASNYVGKTVIISFEGHLKTNSETGGKQGIVFVDESEAVLERVELVTPPEAGYRSYIISRVIPEGTVRVRFSEFMVASTKVFQIRKIRVRLNNEAALTTTDYYAENTNETTVDVFARNNMGVEAAIHDGELFRLESAPEAVAAIPYSELIAEWDEFANEYPDNVVKETIGETTAPDDAPTEVYPIYRYVITPTARENYSENGERLSTTYGYSRSVLLSAGCHGNEVEAYKGLLLLIRKIYAEGYKYPTLRNLREKVRFIIIPAWNPYGVEHNQRSMASGGSPYSYFNSAVKPGETQAMLDTLELYGPDISLWMDFHTDPYAGSESPRPGVGKDAYPLGCYAYAPAASKLADALYALTYNFQSLFKTEYGFYTHRIFFQSNPSGNGHPSYGISRLPTVVAEIATNMEGFPAALHSGEIMKIALEWYGNCLAEGIRATSPYEYRQGDATDE